MLPPFIGRNQQLGACSRVELAGGGNQIILVSDPRPTSRPNRRDKSLDGVSHHHGLDY
jgi:hypothetical protein